MKNNKKKDQLSIPGTEPKKKLNTTRQMHLKVPEEVISQMDNDIVNLRDSGLFFTRITGIINSRYLNEYKMTATPEHIRKRYEKTIKYRLIKEQKKEQPQVQEQMPATKEDDSDSKNVFLLDYIKKTLDNLKSQIDTDLALGQLYLQHDQERAYNLLRNALTNTADNIVSIKSIIDTL